MTNTFDGVSVAILAGGLGTRLQSAVPDRPKVLAPVSDRPFLAYLLDQLAEVGCEEATLLVGFAAEQVRATFGERHGSMRLHYSREPQRLGTGGAVRYALPELSEETILLLNGDSFCEVDFAALRSLHETHPRCATLTLTHVPDAGRYGRARLSFDSRVARFEEKNPAAGSGWINAGVYLFERELLQGIPASRPVSLERECLPMWVESGRVWGFRTGGRFIDIGTPESYREAEAFFARVSGLTVAEAAA